ncbi:MAG TPA: class I tRNA ligase family protein, partial [Candidatus Limnocylindrales bacterium]|nr:class I tRNA ligase family protein [Candidatus Limnocylindrales bacterium]
FEKVWEHWMTNIRDWNVSRQLWWGHRIPAWYCPDGHATVSDEPDGPDACEVCGRPAAELTRDPDIFDTWFSSGLWPFSTLGWPDETEDLRRFYPGTVMETGYDILFFWVARMMMLGIELAGDAPFETVYLSGLIRDPYGAKMSKTKGNTVDPLATIDELGADALRFALVHGTTPGVDQRFGTAKVENARNFANKLWNATRFVLGARPSSIAPDAERRLPSSEHLGPADRWLLSRLAATTAAVDRAMADYSLGEVTRLLYDAIWSEYCDWGIELAKVRLSDDSLPPAEREATWWTLVEVLDSYLRLLHPVMPFITETLWAAIPHRAADPALLIVARWPGVGERDRDAEAEVGALIDLVRAVRNARADARVEPAAYLPLDVYVEPELGHAIEALRPAVERLARARPLRRHLTREDLHGTAGAGRNGLAVIAGRAEAIVGTGVTDSAAGDADRTRLEKELGDAERLLESARARLANDAFTSKAPAAIVEGARAREAELADQVDRLRDRLDR